MKPLLTVAVLTCAACGAQTASRPVTNVPFTAEIVSERVQTLADGTRVQSVGGGRLCRDSAGRVRRETTNSGPGAARGRLVIIDPVDRVIWSLDAKRKTARPDPFLRGQGLPAESPDSVGPVIEDLGTRTLEGFAARGTRTTSTVPAGEVGNDLAMKTVYESWYSPELHTTMLSISRDPRFGESTYRLQNVIRGEPDPALFRPPSDYQVIESAAK